MNEFSEILDEWSTAGNTISVARVIKTWGSSPRPSGSFMLVNSDGKMAGSVSGGCVEGAVVKSALQNREPQRLDYGVSDDDAWSVGLSCGGRIQVFVQPTNFSDDPVWKTLKDYQQSNRSCILVSSLEDGSNTNTLLTEEQDQVGDEISNSLVSEAWKAYSQRTHTVIEQDGKEYFIHLFPRKAQMMIIGAAHITTDLVALGNQFGFETIVIDPRGYFAENTTFTDPPSQLLQKYPSEVLPDFPLDAYTFCAILSHDPKIDDDALKILLKADVGYIGALGSRKTHAKRTERLLAHGFDQETIDKIAAPIGMPIHAKSAKEIALAVLGQIIEAKNRFL